MVLSSQSLRKLTSGDMPAKSCTCQQGTKPPKAWAPRPMGSNQSPESNILPLLHARSWALAARPAQQACCLCWVGVAAHASVATVARSDAARWVEGERPPHDRRTHLMHRRPECHGVPENGNLLRSRVVLDAATTEAGKPGGWQAQIGCCGLQHVIVVAGGAAAAHEQLGVRAERGADQNVLEPAGQSQCPSVTRQLSSINDVVLVYSTKGL